MTTSNEFASLDIAALAKRLDRPIVLVGLMGVGKSTVGQRLAALLGVGFVDSDYAIEEAAHLSIAEIFGEFGEDYFRAGERRVIARLLEEDHGVVATGGGAFVDKDTRALILQSALAVWLDCDIETLVARTARRETRPLLKTGDPRSILTTLQQERSAAYAEAPIRIETGDYPHHQTALKILEAIDAWM